MKKDFVEGAKAATPIILGYIPVGIAYGMLAKATGLTFFKALSFSLFVYTGAGQMAAVTMLAQNAAYVTIVFTVFILNLRHIIMSTCIMEKMEKLWKRWKKQVCRFVYFYLFGLQTKYLRYQ